MNDLNVALLAVVIYRHGLKDAVDVMRQAQDELNSLRLGECGSASEASREAVRRLLHNGPRLV